MVYMHDFLIVNHQAQARIERPMETSSGAPNLELDLVDDAEEVLALAGGKLDLEGSGLAGAVVRGEGSGTPGGTCIDKQMIRCRTTYALNKHLPPWISSRLPKMSKVVL